jgi:hypothetical protein
MIHNPAGGFLELFFATWYVCFVAFISTTPLIENSIHLRREFLVGIVLTKHHVVDWLIAFTVSMRRLRLAGHLQEDAVYPYTEVDSKGRTLSDTNKYTLTFAKARLSVLCFPFRVRTPHCLGASCVQNCRRFWRPSFL